MYYHKGTLIIDMLTGLLTYTLDESCKTDIDDWQPLPTGIEITSFTSVLPKTILDLSNRAWKTTYSSELITIPDELWGDVYAQHMLTKLEA